MNSFTFNGTNARDFGLIPSGGQTFGSPQRAQQMIQVPGRNGDIIIDGGRWENIEITYHAYCAKFIENRNLIADWLNTPGYHRLEDDWNPAHFRQASFAGPLEWDTFLARHGETDLVFNCKPQKWLYEGENTTTFTSSGEIVNPTAYNAKPLLRAYGTGTMTVNGTEVTVSSADGYTDIDCELMDCFKGSTNCNLNVTVDEFPELKPGSNEISFTGFSRIEITPRWWEL
jgi:phage-related protein